MVDLVKHDVQVGPADGAAVALVGGGAVLGVVAGAVLDPVAGWLAGVHWLPFGIVVDGVDRFAGWAPLWAQLLVGLVVGVAGGVVLVGAEEDERR